MYTLIHTHSQLKSKNQYSERKFNIALYFIDKIFIFLLFFKIIYYYFNLDS